MNWFMENMGYQENYLPFYQAELGNEVRLLCSRHYPGKRNFVEGNKRDNIVYEDQQLEIRRLKSLFIKFFAEQNWYFNLKKEINDFRPDVIHLHHIWDLPSLQFIITDFVNKNNVKIFVDNHIDNGNFNFRRIYKKIYYFGFIKKIIIPLMLKRNFLFLPVNPCAEQYLNTYFGIPRDRIKSLPLGINNREIFFSLKNRQEIRGKYKIGEKDIVFLFSGVFERSKALGDLLNAFKILTKRYNNLFLFMIGKGQIFEDCEFKALQKEGKIILPGWQSKNNLYRWYSAADIGVLPGKLGGLRDILAAARPLIVSDDLAVSYLVEYNNGLVFKRADVHSLLGAMETYIQNPDLISTHGQLSLRLVTEKISWEEVSKRSLRLYAGESN